MRNSDDYLSSLDDGREVWVGTERIDKITAHPAFSNAARVIGTLFDLSSVDVGTPPPRPDATPGWVAYDIPTEQAHLKTKRLAYQLWARHSYGFLGRSPDYMAAGVAGFAAAPAILASSGFDGTDHARRLHQRAQRDSIFFSFTITNPSRDRSRPLYGQTEPHLFLRVDNERDDGIIVSGSKLVGTAAVFSDEIVVGTIEPLHPDDTNYAVTFVLPVNAPGVRLVSRTSYEANVISVEDQPLSARFDENDALLICESVFVPWERVLTYRDVQATFDIWWKTPAYAYMAHQASVRFWTKLEFLAGVAILIARANTSISNPTVNAEIGRLVGYVEQAKSMCLAAEYEYEDATLSTLAIRPNTEIVNAQRILAGEIYPRFLHQIRMIAGGSLIQLPASVHDLHAPIIGDVLQRYSRSVHQSAVDRIALMKLAWDATSSDFASRHAHYEQFYQGAPQVYLSQAAASSSVERLSEFAASALVSTQEKH